jgi:hypothetical protein
MFCKLISLYKSLVLSLELNMNNDNWNTSRWSATIVFNLYACGSYIYFISGQFSYNTCGTMLGMTTLLKWCYKCQHSPTSNYLTWVEKVSGDSKIPLGKILFGSLYSLLNIVSQHLMQNEPIAIITGPWWLLQLWLNLHLHQLVAL